MKPKHIKKNKKTNKTKPNQTDKFMFIKLGFSRTNMFLPWHVPVRYSTKMASNLNSWNTHTHTRKITLNNWIARAKNTKAIVGFMFERFCDLQPQNTKFRNNPNLEKHQLFDDQTVLVDRDISTSQDPWATTKNNHGLEKTVVGKTKSHARPSFHLVFEKIMPCKSAHFQEIVETWSFLA